MQKLKVICLLGLALPALTACQTSMRLAPSQTAAVCLALSRSDVLPVLTDSEKALIRTAFSRETMDRLKTPQAIMRAIGC